MTKDQLKELRHKLIRVAELFQEGYTLLSEVTRVLLNEEDPIIKKGNNSNYTPNSKTTKGDPLAELMHNLSPADREKLVAGLEKKVG